MSFKFWNWSFDCFFLSTVKKSKFAKFSICFLKLCFVFFYFCFINIVINNCGYYSAGNAITLTGRGLIALFKRSFLAILHFLTVTFSLLPLPSLIIWLSSVRSNPKNTVVIRKITNLDRLIRKRWPARDLNHILKSLSGRSFSLFSGKTTVPVFCVPAFWSISQSSILLQQRSHFLIFNILTVFSWINIFPGYTGLLLK